MSTHAPHPMRGYRGLLPIEIDGHALYEFSRGLTRDLKHLEGLYPPRRRPRSLVERKTWQPLPKKPR